MLKNYQKRIYFIYLKYKVLSIHSFYSIEDKHVFDGSILQVAFQQTSQGKNNVNSNSQASQNACSSMCDEIVTLWKLAALNPCISPLEREILKKRLIQYHTTVLEKVGVKLYIRNK